MRSVNRTRRCQLDLHHRVVAESLNIIRDRAAPTEDSMLEAAEPSRQRAESSSLTSDSILTLKSAHWLTRYFFGTPSTMIVTNVSSSSIQGSGTGAVGAAATGAATAGAGAGAAGEAATAGATGGGTGTGAGAAAGGGAAPPAALAAMYSSKDCMLMCEVHGLIVSEGIPESVKPAALAVMRAMSVNFTIATALGIAGD